MRPCSPAEAAEFSWTGITPVGATAAAGFSVRPSVERAVLVVGPQRATPAAWDARLLAWAALHTSRGRNPAAKTAVAAGGAAMPLTHPRIYPPTHLPTHLPHSLQSMMPTAEHDDCGVGVSY